MHLKGPALVTEAHLLSCNLSLGNSASDGSPTLAC